jgi:hypothetical protein
LSEARSQKGPLTIVRSKKPVAPTFDCQKPEGNTLHRGAFFLLLASGFWLLDSTAC